MIHRFSSSIRTKAILGSLSLLALGCAWAQAPPTEVAPSALPLAQPVPLVSGACPAVHQGGFLSLDWNPGFLPSWPVTGLKSFRLIFRHVLEDGVNLNPASRLALEVGPGGRMTAIGNGFFHIEARLPFSTRPGTYHLVGAHSSAELLPDYQGEAPEMTISPVPENFCITVVAVPRGSASPPPE